MKWYKFGFTRLFDNLSLEIRHGRLTRDAAIEILRCAGDQTPRADIAKFCAFAGITETQFHDLALRFLNLDIWEQRPDATWWLPGFLISDWRWEPLPDGVRT